MPWSSLPASASLRGEASAGDVQFYAMSAYTTGVRKPGHFHLLTFEEGQNERINRFVPHCHDFFEIVWLPRGRGEVRSDLRAFPVEPRTLFFVAPGQVHAWRFTEPPEGEIVSFTRDFFRVNAENPGLFGRLPFLQAGAAEPILRLDAEAGARMDDLFRELRAAASDPAPGRDDLVRAYLTVILTHIRRAWQQRPGGGAPEVRTNDVLACRFLLSLEENFPRVLSVHDYAEILQVSRSHLNEELRRHSGRSASEIIHDRLLLEAQRLLVHSTLTIAEIGYRLQFDDPSYFGRFFRKCSGCTPGEYRQKARQNAAAG